MVAGPAARKLNYSFEREESSDDGEIYSSLLRSFAALSPSRTSSELPVPRFIPDFVNHGENVSKESFPA